MKSLLSAAVVAGLLAAPVLAPQAQAHCQVPCGIYDDHARVDALSEDVTTIAKAVANITELAGKTDAQSVNQATRWVMTKEQHASRIITTIAEYFLAQKVKPADPKDAKAWQAYVTMLADHHQVMQLAMKAKQTVDPKVVAGLAAAVEHLGHKYWPAPKK
jgi:nickel superoxide dismutase